MPPICEPETITSVGKSLHISTFQKRTDQSLYSGHQLVVTTNPKSVTGSNTIHTHALTSQVFTTCLAETS